MNLPKTIPRVRPALLALACALLLAACAPGARIEIPPHEGSRESAALLIFTLPPSLVGLAPATEAALRSTPEISSRFELAPARRSFGSVSEFREIRDTTEARRALRVTAVFGENPDYDWRGDDLVLVADLNVRVDLYDLDSRARVATGVEIGRVSADGLEDENVARRVRALTREAARKMLIDHLALGPVAEGDATEGP